MTKKLDGSELYEEYERIGKNFGRVGEPWCMLSQQTRNIWNEMAKCVYPIPSSFGCLPISSCVGVRSLGLQSHMVAERYAGSIGTANSVSMQR